MSRGSLRAPLSLSLSPGNERRPPSYQVTASPSLPRLGAHLPGDLSPDTRPTAAHTLSHGPNRYSFRKEQSWYLRTIEVLCGCYAGAGCLKGNAGVKISGSSCPPMGVLGFSLGFYFAFPGELLYGPLYSQHRQHSITQLPLPPGNGSL